MLQHFVNNVFTDILDQFVIIYLNDILVFSESPGHHYHHIKSIMERLQKNCWYAELEKCTSDTHF